MTNIYDSQSMKKIYSLETKTKDASTQKRNIYKYVLGSELFDGRSKLTLRRILNIDEIQPLLKKWS